MKIIIILVLFLFVIKTGAQENVKQIYEQFLNFYLPLEAENEICKNDANLVKTQAMLSTEWAQIMMDSSAMPPNPGMIHGSLWDFGNFDNCLLLETTDAWDSNLKFVPQYCLVDVKITFQTQSSFMYNLYKNHTTRWAFCLPSSCDARLDLVPQVQKSMDFLVMGSDAAATVSVRDTSCRVFDDKRDEINDGWTIFTIIGFCLLGVLVIVASIVDHLDIKAGKNRAQASKGKIALLAFSALTNGKSILSTARVRGSIDCVNGLRFLSVIWIMMGHKWQSEVDMPDIKHDQVVESLAMDISKQTILNAYLGVDTFFVLGGFLLSYIFMRGMDVTKKFDVFTFYLYRYLRLTPPMALMIWFYARILTHTSWGPRWYEKTLPISESCHQHWWVYLLYANNYVKPDEQCFHHAWYLAVEMQIFIFSPFLMYPLWRWPKIGFAIAAVLIVNVIVWPYYITVVNEYPWQKMSGPRSSENGFFFNEMYAVVWTRYGPYVIGILLGYFMHKCRGQKINIKPLTVAICWLLCCVLGLACILAMGIQYQIEYNKWAAGAYSSLHHLVWAMCISWIIFACHHGYGGILNRFLSNVYFQPLARLTYCYYLTHLMVQMFEVATMRIPPYYSMYNTFSKLPWEILLTLTIAFIVNLASETPIIILEKTFLKKAQKPTKKNEVKLEEVKSEETIKCEPSQLQTTK